ncbi:hypothetical protein [Phytohabitans rumicis]|uniref:Uncharacterized protein n=1 Tax=Phytohabitans rumicis TaxID=1076125 RepID=A0A6V8LCY8_9ACTN|nr:hypothetical protein [Phytohabitans rumicis]GFJ92459.1 hypothetical protein Prum_061010 [Phytohabitans rumicis]
MAESLSLPVEVCVYRDGDPLVPAFIHLLHPNERCSDVIRLNVLGLGPLNTVDVNLQWDGEVTPGWWGFRVMLADNTGGWVGLNRPGLLHTQPSDVPTVVTFVPATRTRFEDPVYGGVLALLLRTQDRYRPLPDGDA